MVKLSTAYLGSNYFTGEYFDLMIKATKSSIGKYLSNHTFFEEF